MKQEGYTNRQIAEKQDISEKTVQRMLLVAPDELCVDGTQIRKRYSALEQYRQQIQGFIEQGFGTSQILKKMQAMYPKRIFKRATLSNFCLKLREEMYDLYEEPSPTETLLANRSILLPFKNEINRMLNQRNTITEIFSTIKGQGYGGSYSLLQQYCLVHKPILHKTRKTTHKVKRKDILSAIWSGNSEISDKDLEYIKAQYPTYPQIETLIQEFRTAYTQKDKKAVEHWLDKYSDCQFKSILSFINGIHKDTCAFYNSLTYEYSNGLLEGSVNKLKRLSVQCMAAPVINCCGQRCFWLMDSDPLHYILGRTPFTLAQTVYKAFQDEPGHTPSFYLINNQTL